MTQDFDRTVKPTKGVLVETLFLSKAGMCIFSRLDVNELALKRKGLVSLKALAAYVADNGGIKEDTVLAMVAAQFGVECFRKIPIKAYDAAVRYLVDLNPRTNVN